MDAQLLECGKWLQINSSAISIQSPMAAVNPEVLKWAREVAGLSVLDAAKKLQLHDSASATAAAKLMQLEAGAKEPSRPTLKKMSLAYRQPILTFYLDKPPKIDNRGEDYRTSLDGIDDQQKAVVDFLVRNIRAKQQIIKCIMAEEGGQEEKRNLGRLNMQDGVQAVSQSIVAATGIRIRDYRKQQNQGKAFSYLREAVESIGIFVILAGNLGSYHTNVNTKAFRGFALSDEVTPFIVINDNDAKTAWSTTLLHELTHIFLGDIGISGGKVASEVEAFCDKVASSILVSDSELDNHFCVMLDENQADIIQAIDSFSTALRVGPTMVSYRLLGLGKISPTQYRELDSYFYTRWQEFSEKNKQLLRGRDGGPSSYVLKRQKLGRLLLETTRRFLESKDLTTSDAATILGVRALRVGDLLGSSTGI
jgi:Zn-dependent peptidase ImmA (M78 family)